MVNLIQKRVDMMLCIVPGVCVMIAGTCVMPARKCERQIPAGRCVKLDTW